MDKIVLENVSKSFMKKDRGSTPIEVQVLKSVSLKVQKNEQQSVEEQSEALYL